MWKPTPGEERTSRHRRVVWALVLPSALLALLAGGGARLVASQAPSATEWLAYGRDSGGSRYSPLDQITRANVTQLRVAWTYRTGEAERKAVSAESAAFEVL